MPLVKQSIFALSIALFLICSYGEAGQWTYIGPDGGSIYRLIPDRRNEGLWFEIAGIDYRLYRSTNSGKNWNSTPFTKLIDLFVHPQSSQVFIIVSHRKLLFGESPCERSFDELKRHFLRKEPVAVKTESSNALRVENEDTSRDGTWRLDTDET